MPLTKMLICWGVKKGSDLTPVGFKARGEHLTTCFPADSGGSEESERETTSDWKWLVSLMKKIDAILWGPSGTTIGETVGEFVGVVRNQDYAIGIQALNVKTTGGVLVDDQGKVPPREGRSPGTGIRIQSPGLLHRPQPSTNH